MRNLMKIIVNLITMLRLIFGIFLIFTTSRITNIKFLILIASIFLTDFIDGLLARTFKVQSLFGSIMDTVSDKVLCIALLIPLIKTHNSAILLLLGEILIALFNSVSFLSGKSTFSSMFGKIKMWVLSISIILGYLNIFKYLSITILNFIYIITFIIQVIVLITYIKYLYWEFKNPKEKKKSIKINNLNDLLHIFFSTSYYLDNKL